jgi:DNA sulfur modification protein DndB
MLLRITTDPRLTENQKARESHAGLEQLAAIRAEVQRSFSGAKGKNVGEYARYIAENKGITPQIILYTPTELFSDSGTLLLPWDTELVAIDGETQLAARFEAAKFLPETGKQLVDVRICYNYPLDWAKQSFHDLNTRAIRVNSSTALAMDTQDALTKVTREVAEIPFFRGRVANDRQIGKNSKQIVTFSALRASVVGFYEGKAGFQHGNKPVEIKDGRDLALVTESAKQWYQLLADKIGPAIEQRLETVAAAPSIMAALGVLGHDASMIEELPARYDKMDSLVRLLENVDWRRGEKWEGLAGHTRPSRVSKRSGKVLPAQFSTGGSGVKDSGIAALAALNDPTNAAFNRIRRPLEMLNAA